jgi:hypothetical protein
VKTGANRGHGVPVTPDERAPVIRGRVFAGLVTNKLVTKWCCEPFRLVITYRACPKLLSRTMKARFCRAFIFFAPSFSCEAFGPFSGRRQPVGARVTGLL